MSNQALQKDQVFEITTPMGHLIQTDYNEEKQSLEGYVINKDTGVEVPLSLEILDGIAAAIRAEQAANYDSAGDDWQESLQDIKKKQSDYLCRLVGQAADFLADKVS